MSRILDNEIMGDEELVERTLRPQYLREYIGQDKVKDQLQIFIEAAKMRDEALDHRPEEDDGLELRPTIRRSHPRPYPRRLPTEGVR